MTDKFIAGSGGGGGKGGGGGSRTPSTDPDSLNSRSFGRIVDLISEGEIEGLVDGNKSIRCSHNLRISFKKNIFSSSFEVLILCFNILSP